MQAGEMELEIIVNPKTTDDGQAIIQVRFSSPIPLSDTILIQL